MTQRAKKALAWTGALLMLAGVFTLYTRPDVMVAVGDMLWACLPYSARP